MDDNITVKRRDVLVNLEIYKQFQTAYMVEAIRSLSHDVLDIKEREMFGTEMA